MLTSCANVSGFGRMEQFETSNRMKTGRKRQTRVNNGNDRETLLAGLKLTGNKYRSGMLSDKHKVESQFKDTFDDISLVDF